MPREAEDGATKANQGESALFDANYYQTGLGQPYERTPYWINLFNSIAEEIIRSLNPKSVLDAGCALGFLVESFWDRGVEAYGFDVSEFAISQVRRDIKPYCRQASIIDPIQGTYDLVTCIEVLEHIPPEHTETAIANLAAVTETILFSSTPYDLTEPTHFNVRPIIGWLKLFKNVGFWPDYIYDAGFLAPHAILLRKKQTNVEDAFPLLSEKIRWKSAYFQRQTQNEALTQALSKVKAAAASQDSKLALRELQKENARLLQELDQAAELQTKLDQSRITCQTPSASPTGVFNVEAASLLNPLMLAQAQSRFNEESVGFRTIASNLFRQSRLALTGRRSMIRADQADFLARANDVLKSFLFDPVWYLKQYPDVASLAVNPLVHFLRHGIAEGRNPGPFFDSQWYLAQYPDVAQSGMFPFIHYLNHGAREGRNASRSFDAQSYLRRYPDVASSDQNALAHYLEFGIKEGRECFPVGGPLDGGAAESNTAGQAAIPAAELARQVTVLKNSSLFDPEWYLAANPDVASAGLDPVTHYLERGAAEKRNPSAAFDGNWYLEHNPDVSSAGLNPLLHFIEHGKAEHREMRPAQDPYSVESLLHSQFIDTVPLITFSSPAARRRISIVTDSINAGSLYGGVGTAIMLATLLARRLNADLRLITRREPPVAQNFADILALNGIAWSGDIDFTHADVHDSRALPVSSADIFLTTSWWTTKSTRASVDPRQIFYLLQEDERMFYPFGDQRLRCDETLRDPSIRAVINSQLLFDHLTKGENGCPNIARDGLWFEPAFPSSNYYPGQSKGALKKFFFYARPNNSRNLYWRGLEAISSAIETGVLDPREWEFNFVGRAIGRIALPGKASIKVHQDLKWSEYAALVRTVDLGFCLMDTPHPSYPPLDLAASGAVVVTNRHANKTSLSQYSQNILCADPSVPTLVDSLQVATRLIADEATRSFNYDHGGLLRDWNLALKPVVERMAELVPVET